MNDQWCPFAIRRDGPATKQGYGFAPSPPGSPKRGIVTHSMEGSYIGSLSRMDNLAQDADGYIDPASWHFSVIFDDAVIYKLYQHYPVNANPWHAGDVDDDGGVRANIDLLGIEFEGQVGTPISDGQVATLARLYRWLQDEHGFHRYERRQTVYHHGEVSDQFTACPSSRIRHDDAIRLLYAQLPALPAKEDEEMPVMIKTVTSTKVWLTNWVWRRHVKSEEELRALSYIGIKGPVTVPNHMLDAAIIAGDDGAL